jgi:hypothetical protein
MKDAFYRYSGEEMKLIQQKHTSATMQQYLYVGNRKNYGCCYIIIMAEDEIFLLMPLVSN